MSQKQQEKQQVAVGKVKKITFKSQYVTIEITDPNILDDINIEGKYPNELSFIRCQININKSGGRIVAYTEDKRGINREILSGISQKEMDAISNWMVERG